MSETTIAGLARAGGVGVETIRYYQRRGLLDVPKSGASAYGRGVRRYGQGDIRKLRFIRSAQAAGFTLEEIGELIALDATNERKRASQLARKRIEALDAKIAELKSARKALYHLATECESGKRGPCPILMAFDHS
jgi:MerR family mercuric resistance operon transcriptional regulator